MHYSLRSYHYRNPHLCWALRKGVLCRVPKRKHTAKKNTWQIGHSAKMHFAEYFFWHTAKCIFAEGYDKSIFPCTFWGPKRIQMKKFSTTKLYNFSRSTSFILATSSFDKEIVTFFIKSSSLSYVSYSFMKLECRYIKFVNNVTNTMSDEQMTKLNFVDLEKLWNFVVGSILIWNHLDMQKLCLYFKILKFEFFKRSWMEKQPKQKL